MPACPGHVDFVPGHINLCGYVPDWASNFLGWAHYYFHSTIQQLHQSDTKPNLVAKILVTNFVLFFCNNTYWYGNQFNHKFSLLSLHHLIIPEWDNTCRNMYRKYRIMESIASSVSQYESYHDQVYRYTPSNQYLVKLFLSKWPSCVIVESIKEFHLRDQTWLCVYCWCQTPEGVVSPRGETTPSGVWHQQYTHNHVWSRL